MHDLATAIPWLNLKFPDFSLTSLTCGNPVLQTFANHEEEDVVHQEFECIGENHEENDCKLWKNVHPGR